MGQQQGMALVVVTSQAGIGRGYYTDADFRALTDWMLACFADQGVATAGVEHCPHHPTQGVGA
jgi:D-glycero-D-manno-heptose 1,7-bisphosphate phosphatase